MTEFDDVQKKLAQMEIHDIREGRVKPSMPLEAYRVGVDFETNRPVYRLSENAQKPLDDYANGINISMFDRRETPPEDDSDPCIILYEMGNPDKPIKERRELFRNFTLHSLQTE